MASGAPLSQDRMEISDNNILQLSQIIIIYITGWALSMGLDAFLLNFRDVKTLRVTIIEFSLGRGAGYGLNVLLFASKFVRILFKKSNNIVFN